MKKNNSSKIFAKVVLLSCFAIMAIGGMALYNFFSDNNKFYKSATINGVLVGGMDVATASNVLQTNFASSVDQIAVTLNYEDKSWKYRYSDFEIVDDFSPLVQEAYMSTYSSNILDRRIKINELKKNNFRIDISYRKMLGGFDEKLDDISNQIYQELIEPSVIFDPNSKQIFTYNEGQSEVVVDRSRLEQLIDEAFKLSKNISV